MAEERTSAGNPIVSLLASSAGASALLVVVGFSIQQGIRSLIGVSARRPLDVASYVVDVAYFVEDTAGVLVEHGLAIVIVAAALFAIVMLARRLKKRLPERMRTREFVCIALIVVAFVKLLAVDWAVISINDFFRKPITTARDFGPGFLIDETAKMWDSLLRAHDAGGEIHNAARAELEDAYTFYVLAGALIAAACLTLLRTKRDDGYASAAVVVAMLQLLLIAYAYGKFERSTFYPCVALTLRESAPPAQNVIMMSEDGGTVTVFNAKDDRFHRISWSEIREIALLEENDVLLAHIAAVPSAARDRAMKRGSRCLD